MHILLYGMKFQGVSMVCNAAGTHDGTTKIALNKIILS